MCFQLLEQGKSCIAGCGSRAASMIQYMARVGIEGSSQEGSHGIKDEAVKALVGLLGVQCNLGSHDPLSLKNE